VSAESEEDALVDEAQILGCTCQMRAGAGQGAATADNSAVRAALFTIYSSILLIAEHNFIVALLQLPPLFCLFDSSQVLLHRQHAKLALGGDRCKVNFGIQRL
jgi:hypothetical protein